MEMLLHFCGVFDLDMRILLLVKSFDLGGAEGHVCDLANALVDLNHNVWLVTKPGRQLSRLSNKIKYIELKLCDFKIWSQTAFLKKLIVENKIDVIHAHQRLAIKVGCKLSKQTKIPVVATIHGRHQHDLRTASVRKQLDKVITVSRFTNNSAISVSELSKKTNFIPNGISFNDYVADDNNRLNFFYVSRMDKRHSEVIAILLEEVWPKLLKKSPDAMLNIVGDGEYLNEIKGKAQELNKVYGERVICHGYHSKVNELLKKASLTFGVGRVAIESLGYGIPVFSMKNTRCGDIVTQVNYKQYSSSNFVNISGSNPDAESIITELEKFVDNKDFYKSEALKIGQHIRSKYHQDQVINKVVNVYEEVIED